MATNVNEQNVDAASLPVPQSGPGTGNNTPVVPTERLQTTIPEEVASESTEVMLENIRERFQDFRENDDNVRTLEANLAGTRPPLRPIPSGTVVTGPGVAHAQRALPQVRQRVPPHSAIQFDSSFATFTGFGN